MVEDRLKTAGFAIALVTIVASLQVVNCGPSAQQEHELLLLDALSRKQISSSSNAISNNNYESNAIMDMLGRSMLFGLGRKSRRESRMFFHFRFHLITIV
jgi:hypothetical protein